MYCFVLWIDLFTNEWVLASYIGHLKNIGSLNYASRPNVDILLCNIKKSQSIILPPVSFKKSLRTCIIVTDIAFQNSKILLISLNNLWQLIPSIIFFKVADLFWWFLKKYLPKTQVWITIICQLIVQVNGHSVKKSS